MLYALITLLAEEPAKQPPAPGGAEVLSSFLPLLVIMVLGYFLLIRSPMKRQEQERKAMLDSLKKNDKVLTSAGIYGSVVGVSEDKDEVTVQVADNVRLRMTKASIVRKIDDTPKDERVTTKESGA
jgi:preprotein translocase subunit YajC